MVKEAKETDALLELLVQKRTDRNLTQADLSKRIGKSLSYVGQIERGDIELTLDTLITICKAMNEHANISDWIKESKPANYQVTSGDFAAKNGPSKVVRYGMDNENFDYYSLLDPKSSEQMIITDFQMALLKYPPNHPTPKHYHWGDEFTLTLEGELKCGFLSFEKSSNRDPYWEPVALTSDPNTLDYFWIEAWLPHYYEAGAEGAWGLHIFLDPRGEGGLYSYPQDESSPSSGDQVHIIDESNQEKLEKLSFDAIKTGIGIRVKRGRLKADMSLETLVERCKAIDPDIKVSKSSLTRIENGEMNPPLGLLFVLTKALDIKRSNLIPPSKMSDFGKIKDKEGEKEKHYQCTRRRKLISEDVNAAIDVEILEFVEGAGFKPKHFPDRDIALFVLDGIVEFRFWETGDKDKNEEEENIRKNSLPHDESKILKKWSTIYVKNKRIHTIGALTSAKVVWVSKKRRNKNDRKTE